MTEVLARATVTCHQRFYYLTGVDTVTQANEWSQLRTVEMTSTRCWTGAAGMPNSSACSHDLPREQ
jgi:hypothetical protein